MRHRADECALGGAEDEELEEKVVELEAELDKSRLRLLVAACKGGACSDAVAVTVTVMVTVAVIGSG